MAAMAGKEKVTTMVLNVDLQCSKCYKKVKKLLCKFPEIRDRTYDEKANEVTIKVVCCSPEKIRDKLYCKGGGSIKSIEIKDGLLKPKGTTMVLNVVDLQCSKCYKKVKKLLCKFPEIRDQTYDEKANKVTIKVVCCSPEKIRDKLCCKGGGCIKSIEIVKPPPPPPPPRPKPPPPRPRPPTPPPPRQRPPPPPPPRQLPPPPPRQLPPPPPRQLPPPPPHPRQRPPPPPPPRPRPPPPVPAGRPGQPSDPIRTYQSDKDDDESKLRYPPGPPPASPVIGFWCSEGSGHGGMPGNPCYGGGPVQYIGYYGRPIYDSWGGGCCDYFSEENQQSCSIM